MQHRSWVPPDVFDRSSRIGCSQVKRTKKSDVLHWDWRNEGQGAEVRSSWRQHSNKVLLERTVHTSQFCYYVRFAHLWMLRPGTDQDSLSRCGCWLTAVFHVSGLFWQMNISAKKIWWGARTYLKLYLPSSYTMTYDASWAILQSPNSPCIGHTSSDTLRGQEGYFYNVCGKRRL